MFSPPYRDAGRFDPQSHGKINGSLADLAAIVFR